MIEFKVRENWDKTEKKWKKYDRAWILPDKQNFGIYLFRIDGVVYDRHNDEFVKNFEKAKLWEKLSD